MRSQSLPEALPLDLRERALPVNVCACATGAQQAAKRSRAPAERPNRSRKATTSHNPSPSAADLIAGHKQLIERAKARGLKVYGATLTPFEGAAYWSSEGEAKRQALNDWIRTSKAYDAVVDFDQVTRDPAAPTKFLPAYDSGDHLHPGDAGYKAMGEAVDLKLF